MKCEGGGLFDSNLGLTISTACSSITLFDEENRTFYLTMAADSSSFATYNIDTRKMEIRRGKCLGKLSGKYPVIKGEDFLKVIIGKIY